jgi:shikimate dehydrogenase
MKKQSFVLFGHPVKHSASAAMFTAAFRAAGLPHSYSPVDVGTLGALERAVGYLRDGVYDGANVTLPYKREVLGLADRIDESAARALAANVLVRDANDKVVAYNTDVGALQAEIVEATADRRRAAILGAGGAATAAIAACKALGFSVIGVTTRSWTDTEAIVDSPSSERVRVVGGLASVWPSHEHVQPSTKLSMAMRMQWTELAQLADIVIQATSAGMQGADPGDEVASVVPFEAMSKRAFALDLVYRPPTTPFIEKARKAGIPAASGIGMLVRQAEAAYKLWLGQAPAPAVMRNAVDALIAGDS